MQGASDGNIPRCPKRLISIFLTKQLAKSEIADALRRVGVLRYDRAIDEAAAEHDVRNISLPVDVQVISLVERRLPHTCYRKVWIRHRFIRAINAALGRNDDVAQGLNRSDSI